MVVEERQWQYAFASPDVLRFSETPAVSTEHRRRSDLLIDRKQWTRLGPDRSDELRQMNDPFFRFAVGPES